MLGVIDESLSEILDAKSRTIHAEDRLAYFCEIKRDSFSRKDYMRVFTDISTATASRDLKLGVEMGLFEKVGDKTNTMYNFK
jgi:Fic family protein